MIKHFYHVYADGTWREAVTEHLAALNTIDKNTIDFHVVVVGSTDNCIDALGYIVGNMPTSVHHHEVRYRTEGWEQETLSWLKDDADSDNNDDHPYLYCHTKGSYNTAQLNVEWRRSMTRYVIGRWRDCLKWISLVDTVGCHWLTPQEYPSVDTPFYGGNYWWATARYIRRLPQLTHNDRWDAERWIGQRNPTTHDFYPSWPNFA